MRELMERYGWDEPFLPMNVKNSGEKLEKLFKDDNYVAELKRDGSRYVCIDGRFFSRKLSENKKQPETYGMPVEKTDNIPHLAEFFSQFGPGGIIVDGEIYYPGRKSNTVTGIMGCDPWKACMRQGFGEFLDNNDPVDWSVMWAQYDSNGGVAFAFDALMQSEKLRWRPGDTEDWRLVSKLDKDFWDYIHLGPIRYMIFDILHLNGTSYLEATWEERRDVLDNWFEKYVQGTEWEKYITISVPYETENGKRALMKWAEANREEGLVFKNRTSLYVPGKRPEHHWYRIKGKIYADVVVMGVEPPEAEHKGKPSELGKWPYWESVDGKFELNPAEHGGVNELVGAGYRPISRYHYYGWIGSVVFGLYKDGELVKAGTCSGMDDETRALFTERWQEFVENQTVIEISAMERTHKGMFRHPQFERFRDDKSAADCLWEVEMGE